MSRTRADILRDELKVWQSMYIANGERSILSWHTTSVTNIRLAVSSVMHVPGGLPIVASVLPRTNGESKDNLCDIILTSRVSRPMDARKTEHQGHVEEQAFQLAGFAKQLVDILTNDPADGIPALVKSLSLNPTSFFFVSPEDYGLISHDGRQYIERQMAEVAQVLLSP